MDIKDFKTKLIKLRDSVQDYLDYLAMDEVDNKKPEKKPEPKGADKSDVEEDEDGKKEKED